jgi:hypothetical protein
LEEVEKNIDDGGMLGEHKSEDDDVNIVYLFF